MPFGTFPLLLNMLIERRKREGEQNESSGCACQGGLCLSKTDYRSGDRHCCDGYGGLSQGNVECCIGWMYVA